jgi:hypothetical protein
MGQPLHASYNWGLHQTPVATPSHLCMQPRGLHLYCLQLHIHSPPVHVANPSLPPSHLCTQPLGLHRLLMGLTKPDPRPHHVLSCKVGLRTSAHVVTLASAQVTFPLQSVTASWAPCTQRQGTPAVKDRGDHISVSTGHNPFVPEVTHPWPHVTFSSA